MARKIKPEIAKKMMQAFALFIFVFGLVLLLVVTKIFPGDEREDFNYTLAIVLLGSFTICSIVGLIVSFVIYLEKKNAFAEERGRRLQRANDRQLANLLLETDLLINDSRRERSGAEKKTSTLKTKREYNITNYYGDDKNKKCSICKLELRKRQQKVQCNKCLSIFHKEHLEDWLENKDSCPVCNENIVDIVAIVKESN